MDSGSTPPFRAARGFEMATSHFGLAVSGSVKLNSIQLAVDTNIDEWLLNKLDDLIRAMQLELMELHHGSSSTVFCTQCRSKGQAGAPEAFPNSRC